MELVQPEFIFLNETLIFQFEAIATTDILHGDFNYVLTSDDSFDPELPSQFGNEKGLNIQHYLVKFISQILTTLDTNNEKEKYDVLATLVDWSIAFDRIDHNLGIKSFIENSVRPTLTSYFQNHDCKMAWSHIHNS